jgi:peptide/nickel transport system substrate-binding protein
MNPFGVPSYQAHYAGGNLMIEPLLVTNLATGERHKPWLATGYEWDPASNFKVITLFLRDDVHWSDGESFTADDVVFTVNMLKENPGLTFHTKALDIKEVTAVDAYTVRFELQSSAPRFVDTHLSYSRGYSLIVVPEHIWKDVNDYITYTNPDPVWTGPYKLMSAEELRSIFVRDENYWNKENWMPAPKYFVCIYVGTVETQILMFARGEVDASGDIAEKEARDLFLSQVPDGVVTWSPGIYMYAAAVNNLNYPLNIPEVRRALLLSLDRDKLAVVLGIPSWPAPGIVPPQLISVANLEARENPELKLEYNLEKAAELLESVGFTKDTDGKWLRPDGELWTLEVNVRDLVTYKEISIEMGLQWQDFGITVSMPISDSSTWYEKWYFGQTDITPGRGAGSHAMWSMWQTYSLWRIHEIAPEGTKHPTSPGFGANRYMNETLNGWIDQLEVLSDDSAEALELYLKIEEHLLQYLPFLPILENTEPQVMSTTYWKNWPTPDNLFTQVYPVGPTPGASPDCNPIFHIYPAGVEPPTPPTPGISDVQLGMSTPLLGKLLHPATDEPLANVLVEIKETTDDVTFTTVALTRTDEDGNYYVTLTPSSTGEFDYWLYRTMPGGTFERSLITTITVTSLADELSTQLDALEATLGTQIEDAVEDATAGLTAQITSLSTMVYAAIGIAIIGIIIAIVAVMKK